MNTYYDKKGKVLGKAYGVMKCNTAKDEVNHKAHRHNPEFVLYGPYFCEGYPKTELYDQPIRKPVN